jgi:hypothetical protein
MSKKKIEEEFLSYLIPLIESEAFILTRKQLTGEHIASFKRKIANVEFEWTLLFHRHGNIEVYFHVSYDETSSLLNQYSKNEHFFRRVFSFSILTYLSPENTDIFFHTGFGIESPHSKDLMNGYNLERAAHGIFIELFKKPVPKIIEKLDSLEKADSLLNEPPTVDLVKQEFEWLIYSPNKVFQLMSSLLVGKVVGRQNLSELATMYSDYISDIEPGDREDVDLIRSVIPYLFQA